jgi:hypothetical protein
MATAFAARSYREVALAMMLVTGSGPLLRTVEISRGSMRDRSVAPRDVSMTAAGDI